MFKTFVNAVPSPGEKNLMASMTVPDQSMPLREIVRRFANGEPLPRDSNFYDDDEDDPMLPANWEQLDLSEKFDYVRQHKEILDEFGRFQEKEKERKQKESIISEYESEKVRQNVVSNA